MQSDTEKYKALKKAIFDKLTYLTLNMEKVKDDVSLAGLNIAWRHLLDIIMDTKLYNDYLDYMLKEKET